MLSARNVTVTVVAIAILSILGSLVSLRRPVDSGGLGSDTFGTRAHGYKAVFELLNELHMPAERSLSPPKESIPLGETFVLWEPDPELVSIEPAYLMQLKDWVSSGGRLVLAPGEEKSLLGFGTSNKLCQENKTVLEVLGLEGVEIKNVDLPTNDTAQSNDTAQPNHSAKLSSTPSSINSLGAAVPAQPLAVIGDGDLASLAAVTQKIAPPAREIGTLTIEPDAKLKPSGSLKFVLTTQKKEAHAIETEDGDQTTDEDQTPAEKQTVKEHILAASFKVGKGEIVVFAESDCLANRWLAQADNAPLAVHLLAGQRRRTIWDEFYHGLTARGNPMVLLTRTPYNVILLIGALCLAVWTWRQAMYLGPPVPRRPPTRRTLSEYVEAMALLFARSRGSRSFVLHEVRSGVLWTLRHRLGLSAAKENTHDVAIALERKDPAAAKQLTAAMAALDRAIEQDSKQIDRPTVELLQQVTACL